MKIVIATPLYPPDTTEQAHYVKELAARLAEQHDVSVVLYGKIPEAVPNVALIPTDKRAVLPLRLLRYFLTLYRETKDADVLFIENGASVELPAGVVARLRKMYVIAHIADTKAHNRAERSPSLRSIERFAHSAAEVVLTELPPKRPEILPFSPRPTDALDSYEAMWAEHIQKITKLFAS